MSVPPGAVVCAAMAINGANRAMKGSLHPVVVARVGVGRPGATGRRRVASNTFDPLVQVNGAARALSVPDGAVGVEHRSSHRSDQWSGRRENRG